MATETLEGDEHGPLLPQQRLKPRCPGCGQWMRRYLRAWWCTSPRHATSLYGSILSTQAGGTYTASSSHVTLRQWGMQG